VPAQAPPAGVEIGAGYVSGDDSHVRIDASLCFSAQLSCCWSSRRAQLPAGPTGRLRTLRRGWVERAGADLRLATACCGSVPCMRPA